MNVPLSDGSPSATATTKGRMSATTAGGPDRLSSRGDSWLSGNGELIASESFLDHATHHSMPEVRSRRPRGSSPLSDVRDAALGDGVRAFGAGRGRADTRSAA